MKKFILGLIMMLTTSMSFAQVANEGDLQPVGSEVFVDNTNDTGVKIETVLETISLAASIAQAVFTFDDPQCGYDQDQVYEENPDGSATISCFVGPVRAYGWSKACAYCGWVPEN